MQKTTHAARKAAPEVAIGHRLGSGGILDFRSTKFFDGRSNSLIDRILALPSLANVALNGFRGIMHCEIPCSLLSKAGEAGEPGPSYGGRERSVRAEMSFGVDAQG